jgi:tetratricopeptide (TPR) repeat protein
MTDHPFNNASKRSTGYTDTVNGRQLLTVCIILALVTLAVYWQVKDHDFINYDDKLYVTENLHVQAGMTIENLKWAFTTGDAANWHPLTWLSHMMDVQLFGLKAGRHHLVNVLLHVLNALLLFLILRHMTKALWPSAFVAALFALHPLHVESVAWVAERKDVLSTLFWMLTLGAYGYYVEHPGYRRYFLVLAFFLLGLMSKPMLVTMPFLLLLLDYWPLGRFRQVQQKGEQPPEADRRPEASLGRYKKRTKAIAGKIPPRKISTGWHLPWSFIRLQLLEKVPLLVFSLLSSIITIFCQQSAMQSLQALPLNARISNALVSYVKYIEKMIWPQDLAVFYPPLDVQPLWHLLGAIFVLSIATFWAIRTIKRFPYLCVGWLWYLGTLIPVIGLVQVGTQAMADRYSYVPLIGLFIIIAWGIPELLPKWPQRKPLLGTLSGIVILVCALLTWGQVQVWHDSTTLFRHALRATVDNTVAHNNLGEALLHRGKIADAIDQFRAALRINPKYAMAWNNLGNGYGESGRIAEAIDAFRQALRITPDYAEAWNNLGKVYGESGRIAEAIDAFQQALRIKPDYAKAWNNLGNIYGESGRIAEAIDAFQQALRIKPDYAEACNSLGVVYGESGRVAEAIDAFRQALRISPNLARAWKNLGTSLRESGRPAEAIDAFQRALNINPDDTRAWFGLEVAYIQSGQREKAIEGYKRLKAIDPAAADICLRLLHEKGYKITD